MGAALLGACGRQTLPTSPFECPEFGTLCEGECVDTSRDEAHCGGCGQVCEDAAECIASKCRESCEAGGTLCADGCVDLDTDPDNCGECGEECGSDQTCVDGACQDGGECGRSEQRCGDACVNLQSSREHCGECFNECSAELVCSQGSCQANCEDTALCDGECVDTQSDPDHCGNCVTRCGTDEHCSEGQCLPGCEAGFSACGEVCVDITSNALHCGECFLECIAGQACVRGVCACPNGGVLCGDACVDLNADEQHCGGCDTPCDGVCNQGACQPVCGRPLVVCDGACVDTSSDPANCGGCGVSCSDGRVCDAGECAGCVGGTSACGNRCVDLSVDPSNCGGCDVVCPAGQVCSGGECQLSCPAPTIDCDGSCVDPRFDPDNCGACGNGCGQGVECRLGECAEDEATCDWQTDDFPIPLGGGISVGDVTLDDACNLYVGMQVSNSTGGQIFAINAETQTVAEIANLPGFVRGLVYHPDHGTLYATTLDRLVAVEPDGSNFRELAGSQAGQYMNGMTLAPTGWGQLGGHLIVAHSTGQILAFDPEDPIPVLVASIEGQASDVEFDGQQLYVAAYPQAKVLRVTPAGVVQDFADLPCEPDGLTVEPGVRVFAACGSSDTIVPVDVQNGTPGTALDADLNPSWAPSALVWDSDHLVVLEETVGLTLHPL